MKDLGELKFFRGIKFSRSKQGIVISQRKYALELVAESGLGGSKPDGTPLETSSKHTFVEFGTFMNKDASSKADVEDKELENDEPYQRLIDR